MTTETRQCDQTLVKAKCGTAGWSRTRYYRGMLLDENHLQEERQYQDDARARLAHWMQGCGILCGLELTIDKDKCCHDRLRIATGMALDCNGCMIRVESEIVLTARDLCPKKHRHDDSCCVDDSNSDTDGPKPYCVVLTYDQCNMGIATVQQSNDKCSPGCNEPARVAEGWCLALIPDGKGEECPIIECCPTSDTKDGKLDADALGSLRHDLCAPSGDAGCCSGCCRVVLGRIELDCKCGTITKSTIKVGDKPVDDSDNRRRYAWSARRLDRLLSTLCKVLGALQAQAQPTNDGGEGQPGAAEGMTPESPAIDATKSPPEPRSKEEAAGAKKAKKT